MRSLSNLVSAGQFLALWGAGLMSALVVLDAVIQRGTL